MTKPAEFSERVPMVEVGEYNDRISIEVDAHISDDTLVFADPSESTWRRERRPVEKPKPPKSSSKISLKSAV